MSKSVATDSPLPTELLTVKNLKTLGGASLMVWIVCLVVSSILPENTLTYWHYRVLAFFLCILITLAIIAYRNYKNKLIYGLLVLGNTCYIFINASGINSISKNQLFSKDSAESSDTIALQRDKKPGQPMQAALLPFIREVDWWPDREITGAIQTIHRENEQLRRQNESLVNEINMARNNVSGSELKQEIQRLHIENDSLRTLLANWKNQSGTNEQAMQGLRNRIQSLENTISALRQENDALQTKLNTCNQSLQNLSSGLDRDIASLKLENSNLSSELTACRKNLNETTNQWKNCESRYQKMKCDSSLIYRRLYLECTRKKNVIQ